MSKCDMCGIEGKTLYSKGSQSISAFDMTATVCSPCVNRAVMMRIAQVRVDKTEYERA